MPRNQNTIDGPIELSGKALFSGDEATARLCPADPGTGILFTRVDMPDKPVVPAQVDTLGNGFNCTVLRQDEVQIRSVEHLLSACMGMQVDNLIVEIDGAEMPACGGCSEPYAEALVDAGITEQGLEKPRFVIEESFAVSKNEASVVGMPTEEGLALSYVLEFDGDVLPSQVLTLEIDPDTFLKELAPARTFALESAYGEFEKRGLGGGVTDENALVIFDDGSVRQPLSRGEAELRFDDEFVRHKLVDLLGDLFLINMELQGKVVGVRSGHSLNTAFASRVRSIFSEEKAPEEYLDIREIQNVLPHRYPFLMVDRILRIDDNAIRGVKNVSMNEQFFQGHYPEYPIMPGVLQLEALAQVAGVLLLRKLAHSGKLALMVGMDGVRLRKPVQPGDQLVLEAEAQRVRSRTAQISARGLVNDEVACEAEMKFMLVDREVL